MKILHLLCLSLLSLPMWAQQDVASEQLKSHWERELGTAQAITAAYTQGRELIAVADTDDKMALYRYNDCYMIWYSGEYILKHKGVAEDIPALCEAVPASIPLNDANITNFLKQWKQPAQLIDHFFMVKALRKGDPFDAARDGITASVRFPIRALNDNDYAKLHEVIAHGTPFIQTLYLQKMKFLFQNGGCSKELEELRSCIEHSVPAGELKEEILTLYRQYAPIMNGRPAPAFTLKDAEGKEHSFDEFRGKVLVIDVWATWCCSCLEKMPKFMKLRDEFKGNNEVQFITVSIDRKKARAKWLKTLEKQGMDGMLNLMPDMDCTSPFEEAYHVVGVPRYIIIDKQGRLVTAYAPSPGEEMKQLIMQALQPKKVATGTKGGTNFEDITFEEALQKAKKRNKPLFVDCYTKSCGPCRWMAQNIFPQKICGDYFNPNYVCIKKDMEVDDGLDIARRYKVMMYPTYLVINPDGSLLCEMLFGRVSDPNLLVEKVKEAVLQASSPKE